jgi:hypothetical protein
MLERRNFLVGVTALICAPAVVRAQFLMPVKIWKTPLIKVGNNLLCNGAEININEYPDLFNILGKNYGGSDNQFNLPDLNMKDIDLSLVVHKIGYCITPQGMILSQIIEGY